MLRKLSFVVLALFIISVLIFFIFTKIFTKFFGINKNTIETLIQPPSQDVVKLINENPSQSGPFTIYGDYKVSVFADLGNQSPRVLDFDDNGVLYASIPSEGKIVALPDNDGDGVSDEIKTVVTGLNRPHGFVVQNNAIYIAETDKVLRYFYFVDEFRISSPQELFKLPSGGRHWTRTIKIHEDKLFTSVGSSCDVCVEKDDKRSSILVSNLDGSDLKVFASGLRNTVFFDFDPSASSGQVRIWGSDMGRDFLGDNLPPDELNIIEEGKDYGWPWCYGKQISDPKFFDESPAPFSWCRQTSPSEFDYPAHVAPLGTTFVKPGVLPPEYEGDLLVSFHGSWNSSDKVGYKIVRVDIEDGKAKEIYDFVTGFLDENGGVLGRPVDLVFDNEGVLYISDDKANVIYRLTNKKINR